MSVVDIVVTDVECFLGAPLPSPKLRNFRTDHGGLRGIVVKKELRGGRLGLGGEGGVGASRLCFFGERVNSTNTYRRGRIHNLNIIVIWVIWQDEVIMSQQ